MARPTCAVLFFGLTLMLGGVGCTDDFTIGRGAADAGPGPAGDDAAAEAAAGMSCGEMQTELARRHDVVTACTSLDGYCENIVKDECECDVGIVNLAGVAPREYASLVAAYKQAGCATTCKACRPPSSMGFACDANLKGTPTGTCTDPSLGF